MSSKKVSVFPPYKGLNSRDGATAGGDYATTLDNMLVKNGGLEMRNGVSYVANLTGTPSGFHRYNSGLFDQLLISTNTGIFDATTGNPIPTGMTGGDVVSSQFNGFLHVANGIQDPERYDGSVFTTTAWTQNTSDPAHDIRKLSGVFSFNHRLYFWDKNTQDFWYSAPDATQGQLELFRLSLVGRFGGNLVTINSLSFDAGSGLDDYLLFFMSSGEVIAYLGSNPSSATNWNIKGIFNIYAPFGVDSIAKVGGDLMILANNDVFSMRDIVAKGFNGAGSKISNIIKDTLGDYQNIDFRWQIHFSRANGWIIVNIPISSSVTEQLILSTLDNTITKFTNLNAVCWGEINKDLYMCDLVSGSVPKIYKYGGFRDKGQPIVAKCIQAYNNFNTPLLKRLSAIKYVLKYSRSVSYQIGVGIDYEEEIDMFQADSVADSTSNWDVSLWDDTVWFTDAGNNIDDWEILGQLGQDFAIALTFTAEGSVRWSRTDLLIEAGKGL